MEIKGQVYSLDIRSSSCCIFRNDNYACVRSFEIENFESNEYFTAQEVMLATARKKFKDLDAEAVSIRDSM